MLRLPVGVTLPRTPLMTGKEKEKGREETETKTQTYMCGSMSAWSSFLAADARDSQHSQGQVEFASASFRFAPIALPFCFARSFAHVHPPSFPFV